MPVQWMSRSEAEAELAAGSEGRLATVLADGRPYITPVNYLFAEGRIYFHSRRSGQKIEALAANPRVCFEVTGEVTPSRQAESACQCSTRYRSVVVHATAELLDDNQEKARVLNLLVAHMATGRSYPPVTADHAKSCAVVALHIQQLSGKINREAHG